MKIEDLLRAMKQSSDDLESTPSSINFDEASSIFSTSVSGKKVPGQKPFLVCGICLETENTDEDEILECDKCGITVHEGCYGDIDAEDSTPAGDDASDDPTEPWFCEPCKAGLTKYPHCELCPNLGGIYKHTDTGKWVHLICALYTPCVGFRNLEKLETVVLEDVKSFQWGNRECVLCSDENFSRTGVCISCDAGLCKTTFHVTCALKNGFLSDIPDVDQADKEAAELLYAHCKLHSVKEEVRKRKSSWLAFESHVSNFKMADDEEECQRILNCLEKIKKKFLKFRRAMAPPKPSQQPYPRLLSTCPEACMKLARKAEVLGVLSKPVYDVNSAIVSGYVRKHDPNISNDFISYFYKREVQLKEIKSMLPKKRPILLKLEKEQKRLTKISEDVRDKFIKTTSRNDALTSEFQRFHAFLCSLAGKSFPVPGPWKPRKTKAAKDKAAESTALLNTAVRECLTCHSTENQHLLIECDTCHNHYHLACVDPPLSYNPKKGKTPTHGTYVWQCTECDSSDEEEGEEEGGTKKKRKSIKPDMYTDPVKKGDGKEEEEDKKGSTKRERKRKIPMSPPENDKPKHKRKSSKPVKKVPTKVDISDIVPKLKNSTPKSVISDASKVGRSRERQAVAVTPPVEVLKDCSVCNKPGDSKTLVKCDECKQCYHFQTCLDPPYKKNPKSKFYGWVCTECDESEEENDEGEEDEEKADSSAKVENGLIDKTFESIVMLNDIEQSKSESFITEDDITEDSLVESSIIEESAMEVDIANVNQDDIQTSTELAENVKTEELEAKIDDLS